MEKGQIVFDNMGFILRVIGVGPKRVRLQNLGRIADNGASIEIIGVGMEWQELVRPEDINTDAIYLAAEVFRPQ